MFEQQISPTDMLAMIRQDARDREFQAMLRAETSVPVPATVTVPREFTRQEALDEVVRHYNDNPDFALHVIEALGGFKAIAKRKPKPKPIDLPMDQVWAAELSIGMGDPDKPRTKVLRPRADQAALQYSIKLQCWFEGSAGDFKDPDWVASAKLRTPARARKDMVKKTASNNSTQPNFTAEYKAFTEALIPFAEERGMLIGWLFQQYYGKHWYPCHIALVPQSFIDDPTTSDGPMIFRPGQVITMPGFRTAYANGKKLEGSFFGQSRGTTNQRRFNGWIAGDLAYHAS